MTPFRGYLIILLDYWYWWGYISSFLILQLVKADIFSIFWEEDTAFCNNSEIISLPGRLKKLISRVSKNWVTSDRSSLQWAWLSSVEQFSWAHNICFSGSGFHKENNTTNEWSSGFPAVTQFPFIDPPIITQTPQCTHTFVACLRSTGAH